MRAIVFVGVLVLVVIAGVLGYYLFASPRSATPASKPEPPTINAPAAPPPVSPESASIRLDDDDSPIPSITDPSVRESDETAKIDDMEDSTPVRVYGTVTDFATGAPVPDALISTDPAMSFAALRESYGQIDESMYQIAGISEKQLEELIDSGGMLPEVLQEAFEIIQTKTDASGAYEFVIDFSWFDTLYCSAGSYARVSRTLEEEHQGDSMRVDFQLRPGARFSGRVSNAQNNEGVVGVTVVAVSGEDARAPFWARHVDTASSETTTGADGKYELDQLQNGAYTVVVRGVEQGWLFDSARAVHVTLAEGAAKDGVDLLVTPGKKIEGTITNSSGEPIEQAMVFFSVSDPGGGNISFDSIGDYSPPISSDENGHYLFTGARPGESYEVSVQHEDFASAKGKVTSPNDDTVAKLDFVLETGVAVSGIAKYEDGTPAGGKSVYLFPPQSDETKLPFNPDFGEHMEFTDDATGEFIFAHVLPGQYTLETDRIWMMREGQRTKHGIPVTVEKDTPVTGLEITVEKDEEVVANKRTIQGTVLSAEGNPAENVSVQATTSDEMMGGRRTVTVQSAKDGSFTLDVEYRGQFDIVAMTNESEAREKNVSEGATVTLRLGPITAVSGTVVNSDGDPVANCKVTLKEPGSGDADTMGAMMSKLMGPFGRGAVGTETTDDFGNFSFKHVEPGTYTVEATFTGKGFGASEQFSLAQGNSRDDVRVVLEEGKVFAGVVVDGTGTPVQGVNIALSESVGGPMESMMMGMPMGMGLPAQGVATSDAEGKFEVMGLRPGKYLLSAKHADFAPFTAKDIDVSDNQSSPYKVTLGKGGIARGQFMVEGKPKSGVMIQMMGEGGAHMATTDAEGRFEVKGLPAGTYMVIPIDMAAMTGGDENAFPSMNFKSATITEGGEVIISFGEGVNVSGKIPADLISKMTIVYMMRPGAPELPDMAPGVDPFGEGIEAMQYIAGFAMAGPDGDFTVTGVDPGEYELRVYASDVDLAEAMASEDVMSMTMEELEERGRENQPKEVFRQPVTVGDADTRIEVIAPAE